MRFFKTETFRWILYTIILLSILVPWGVISYKLDMRRLRECGQTRGGSSGDIITWGLLMKHQGMID